MRRLLCVLIFFVLSALISGCAGLLPTLPTSGSASETAPGPAGAAEPEQPAASESPQQPTAVPVVIVLDASGSMRETDVSDGQATRMDAARDSAKKFVAGLPAGTSVALVTYGDQTPEDAPLEQGCGDVSVKVPLEPAGDSFGAALDGLNPTGWSPIAKALGQAFELVPQGPASVVLVSDGDESCAPPEPCEVTRAAVEKSPELVVSTIGVRASSTELACIARAGNGVYVTADSADQLSRRLEAVRDPNKAATQLSNQGANGIAPGQQLSDIRTRFPDFPEVQTTPGQSVEVVWRDCRWEFNDQQVLTAISPEDSGTIDGIRVGDPISAAAVLGDPVKTEGQWRYYVADRTAKLAWRLQVENDTITRIVLCACLPDPPLTLDNATLDTSGLGPIKLGTTIAQATRNGWMRDSPDCPGFQIESQLLEDRGVTLRHDGGRIIDIGLRTDYYATRSGARVGMTVGELRRLYPRLEQEVKKGYQPYPVVFVRSGDREVFAPRSETTAITDSTRITHITARSYSEYYMYDGC